MNKAALLVVDIQTALIEEHPYHEQEVLCNVKELIAHCRRNQLEVIYVRHDGGPGDELEKGSRGWQVYEEIAPLETERIFDKCYSSAFLNTGLCGYLDEKGIKTLITVGMQTEYCMDATCKSAFEHGYDVIIPEATTTTFDNRFLTAEKLVEFYVFQIWNNRFARVMGRKEVIDYINSYNESISV